VRSATRVTQSRARCTRCGATFVFWRRQAKKRAPGHRKHLWCPRCQRVTAHIEQSDD